MPVDLTLLTISQIAALIHADWKKVYFGAVPYLDAMGTLGSVEDNYGYDSGREIVLYFLSNANGWRGDVARAVKKELKRRLDTQKAMRNSGVA